MGSSRFVRIYGREVSVGEPLPLQADPQFRSDLESSLEILTQTRLMESEEQARNLLEDARIKAEKRLAEARAQAEAQARELLAQARSEADGIREAAREEGFKAGFQEGYSDATAQVEQDAIGLLAGAQCLMESAYLAEKHVLKAFEKHALALVEQVVGRILGERLSESPESILRLIARGVESLYLSGKVKVVVSAQVLQEIRAFSGASAEALATMSRFEFTADPLLDTHQIYIVGQDAAFDFTPQTQARRLLAPLDKHLDLPREGLGSPLPDAASDLQSADISSDAVRPEPESPAPIQEEAPLKEELDVVLTEENADEMASEASYSTDDLTPEELADLESAIAFVSFPSEQDRSRG